MGTDDPATLALLEAYPAASRTARRIAGDAADDLVQDAFLRVWTVRERYPAADLGKILATAVQHTWLDQCRHRRVVREVPIPAHWLGLAVGDDAELHATPPALVDGGSPELIVVRADQAARVRAVVERLPEPDQAALVACYWRGVSQNDRGPTFKSRVQRARKRFRACWQAAA